MKLCVKLCITLCGAHPARPASFTRARRPRVSPVGVTFMFTGELRGLLVHIEIDMEAEIEAEIEAEVEAEVGGEVSAGAAQAAHAVSETAEATADGSSATADVSSATPGSHWPNVFLMLPESSSVRAGSRVRVETSVRLSSPKPAYTFHVSLAPPATDPAAADDAGPHSLRSLGTITYPE